jgi:hypothetical protein
MQPLTTQWGAKAEGDFASAGRDLRARKALNDGRPQDRRGVLRPGGRHRRLHRFELRRRA